MSHDLNAQRPVHFARVTGTLPAWTWRALFDATREAGDGIPVLIVEDGHRPIVILDVDDYNALAESEREESTTDA